MSASHRPTSLGIAVLILATAASPVLSAQTVRVDITPGHATNSFSPLRAMGTAVDRDPLPLADIYSQFNQGQMLASGWGNLTYRLNTELSLQAWHWNPNGTWSDPAGKGYFTGSTVAAGQIKDSFGYDLPHRGFSLGGEIPSALDDGDLTTYWKSNPYLTHVFAKDADSQHPQWVVFDLGKTAGVNAIQINWANPYAVSYQVQYWTGPDAIFDPANGTWQTFASGNVTDGDGGTVTLKLAPTNIQAEYIRVLMTQSSNTCDTHGSADVRNCVGYAIFEAGIGTLNSNGKFTDLVKHAADSGVQTQTYCSSDDPWHDPSNYNPFDGDQPGLDFILTSALTRGLPAMVPVPLLYGTPDDAAAEIQYLKNKGYDLSYIELGEEPDGQFVVPEDYAELYLQWAKALHKVDPKLKLGGPVFQGVTDDIPIWPDAQGNTSWFTRFLNYLRAHHRLEDLSFMSFEHYPFDPCDLKWSRLYREPGLVTHIMDVWKSDGLPSDVPMLITEANISFNANESFMDIFGALWLADYVGGFLSAGGQATFYYQYEPLPMFQGCSSPNSWGTFGMFTVDSNDQVLQRTSQFFAANILTKEWAQPVDSMHQTYPGSSGITDSKGNTLVTVYPLRRPDGNWSVMLVNKDQDSHQPVSVTFHDAHTNTDRYFQGPVTMVTFGTTQYHWHQNNASGSANPDGPAATSTVPGGAGSVYNLPAASITVLRGTIQ